MNWDGKRIRDLRRQMSWSPDDLARRLNCTHKEILNWEMNQSSPSKEIIDLLDLFDLQRLDSASDVSEQARIESILKDHGLDQVSQVDLDVIEK
ncbi:MAG: helix-turn-helix transcriptional regulator [Bdellovibrionales bacterium]|nr:helix-turn-helix transcriptional regulator [Bdellovibrionales bacterium]